MTLEIHKNYMEFLQAIRVKDIVIGSIKIHAEELERITCDGCDCHSRKSYIRIDREWGLSLIKAKDSIPNAINDASYKELKLFKSIYNKYPETMNKEISLSESGEITIK